MKKMIFKRIIRYILLPIFIYKRLTKELAEWDARVNQFLTDKNYQHFLHTAVTPTAPLTPGNQPGYPNVFCVGVQKTATSFLYSILRKHPLISMYPKDMNMLEKCHDSNSFDQYHTHAKKINKNNPVIAHFDVGFISYGKSGIQVIKGLCKSPRIIICLRDPVERAISEFRMRIREFNREAKMFTENHDFKDAIDLDCKREVGDIDRFKHIQAYIKRGQYYEQIRPYIEEFGRENIHFIIMDEDLNNNQSVTIAKLFNFLSILDVSAFKISLDNNEIYHRLSKSPKHIKLALRTASYKKIINPKTSDEVNDLEIVKLNISSDNKYQLNIKIHKPNKSLLTSAIKLPYRIAFEPTFEEKCNLYHTHFKDDVSKLEKIIGRSLSVWDDKYHLVSESRKIENTY